MTTGCYGTNLLLFANARGAGTLLTIKCPAPRTHREANARGLPGGGCSWLELTRTFKLHICLFCTLAALCYGGFSRNSYLVTEASPLNIYYSLYLVHFQSLCSRKYNCFMIVLQHTQTCIIYFFWLNLPEYKGISSKAKI